MRTGCLLILCCSAAAHAGPRVSGPEWVMDLRVEAGKLRSKEEIGGAPGTVVSCLFRAIVNTKLEGNGRRRVSATVSFRPVP